MAFKDITGHRFGQLVVVSRESNGIDGTARWMCVCDCGQTRVVAGTSLRSGRNKSCGCSSPRFTSERILTHGMSRSRVYKIYRGMIARCSPSASPKCRKLYFDKGIRVCERWQSFNSFLEDMGIPQAGMSIDRIDGTKNYEPSNCRWADHKTQANNISSNLVLTLNGQSKTAAQWAEFIGIKANTIVYRVRRGWSDERALQKSPIKLHTEKKLSRNRPCEVCGTIFSPRPSQLRKGHGNTCSQRCNGQRRMWKVKKMDGIVGAQHHY